MTPHGWALGVLVALVVVLIAAAALLIPLRRPAAPRADQEAALRALPADRVARARALHAELRPVTYGSLALGLAVALALGLTPLGAHLVGAYGSHWLVQAVLGGLTVLLLGDVLTVPFAAWRHRIATAYGLSTQGWGGWARDLLVSYAVAAVLGGLVLAGFFALARWVPRWWWAYGAAGAALLVVLLSFVLPVVVEPLFHRFAPLADTPLRAQLLELAARDGVPVRDVLVADASRRTRAVNAYVSGLGPTRRIVLYDTLLTEAPAAEVGSVVAHELGHAKDRDVLTGTLLGALGAAAGVIGFFLLGSWPPLLRLAGVSAVGQPAAIGLLLAMATLAGLVARPGNAFVSRRIEARADAHALALTGDPETFVAMQLRLATVNLADPDPPAWEHRLTASHPSTVERIAAARAYARGAR